MEIPPDMTVEKALALAAEAEKQRARWMLEAQRYKQGLDAVIGRLPAAAREAIRPDKKPEDAPGAVERLLYEVEILRRLAEAVARQYDAADPTVLEPERVAALGEAARRVPVRNW